MRYNNNNSLHTTNYLIVTILSFLFTAAATAGDFLDSDGDGIDDSIDNCTLIANPLQQDTDADGFGNACDLDIAPAGNNDCVVNFFDVNAIRAAFLSTPSDANWNPDADLNSDGQVNFIDYSQIVMAFLGLPGPSNAPNLCTDNDLDLFPSLLDCDDNEPLTYPGAPEFCDGVDNNCNFEVDEDLITDGAGCTDPGLPEFSDTVDTLHIVTLTDTAPNSGTNGHTLSVCLTATDCWTLDNNNFNDLDLGEYDVFSIENVGLSREDIDRVQIKSEGGGSDVWKPACLQMNFDGEPVYCKDLSGLEFGDAAGELEDWTDPAGLQLNCQACNAAPLTHGPMIGAVGSDTAKLWARTDSTRKLELRVAQSAEAVATASPAAIRYPTAATDFTETIDVFGLAPDTEYFYSFESNAASTSVNSFRTAPPLGAPVEMRFALGSCAGDDDQPIFSAINDLDPDLFLFVGDNHYGNTDQLSDLRRFYQWGLDPSADNGVGRSQRAELVNHTATIATWDDHDFVGNNSDGSEPGKAVALRAFSEYWANPGFGLPGVDGVFYVYPYGDIEFFVIDGRYYRGFPDSNSLLGSEQTVWLENALAASNAVFKIMVSGSQWTTEGSSDSWAQFPDAQRSLFQYIADNEIEGVVALSGDVHRSELRYIPGGVGGYDVPELVSSPLAVSNFNCGNSNELQACEDEGNYFIVVDVDTDRANPQLDVEIRSADGTVVASQIVRASELKNNPQVALDPKESHDYNGDGYADLAIRTSLEDIGSDENAGAFSVLYGSTQGLHSFNNQQWSQDSPGIGGGSEPNDFFGSALASGDFNNDGYTDIVAGAYGESVSSNNEAGIINVIFGSASGLSSANTQTITQNSDGVGCCTAMENDRFGYALAVGRFDNDNYDDLAVGSPGEDDWEGAVLVFYGSANGLVFGSKGDYWTQDNTGAGTTAEPGDRFGYTLAAGDFDGDSYDDLAISAPFETVGGENSAGHVTLIYGSTNGLTSSGSQSWHQDIAGIAGVGEDFDRFGDALASGYLNNDAYADLVIGVGREDVGTKQDAGSISIIYGSADGLTELGNQSASLDSITGNLVSYNSRVDDVFGSALATGDFDSDGFSDIAVGLKGRDSNLGLESVGSVVLLRGSANGTIISTGEVILHNGGFQFDAMFGSSLAVGDYNADGDIDLAIGVPGQDVGSANAAGVVDILMNPGDIFAVPLVPDYQLWHQGIDEVEGALEDGDQFGRGVN